jgi:hypothetical protein
MAEESSKPPEGMRNWNEYWQRETKENWRTEPPVTAERQRFLQERLRIKADPETGTFPFGGIELSRSDVEWLLHHHGPIELEEAAKSYPRKGVDLRGAVLDHIDLHSLPLTRMKGGLTWYERGEDVPADKTLWEAASVKMRGADLHKTHLERADLFWAHLEGANLAGVYFDPITDLVGLHLGGGKPGAAKVADLHWNEANLAVVPLKSIDMLGDERCATESKLATGEQKPLELRTIETRDAIRANRQLAAVLQSQGLNDLANHFTYRAQRLDAQMLGLELRDRELGLRQRLGKVAALVFSKTLNGLAGYGHKPQYALGWYLATLTSFALAYWFLGFSSLGWTGLRGGVLLSLNAFHGRAFSPGGVTVQDWWSVLPAIEAVVGLFIEISLIATFTRRFLGG